MQMARLKIHRPNGYFLNLPRRTALRFIWFILNNPISIGPLQRPQGRCAAEQRDDLAPFQAGRRLRPFAHPQRQ